MPIGGSATEFNITGAKLKVSGGVQVTGSIAYTDRRNRLRWCDSPN